ncbi:hypothetical protein [Vitiosangium sp. GDMCC 1.1324]|uniref:hypothetical protein n=1 Tax=Vitiosangium sp. (strain GDMCC 1.1324) TaxID=2138576 RepID=UPI000D3B5E0A|nr:hypothetical protein [Vitiosangium sp. GDMCC 1.1324]PTL81923.1 hypothetical protein DAT35_19070 [Vitiosangium sp. GDMCC 1.1324]
MRRQGWALCLALALGCTPEPSPRPDGGTDAGDNTDVLNGSSPFARTVLDEAARELQPLALAVGPGDVVGVAYFSRVGDTKNYELRFLEWKNGKASQPEVVATVEVINGVSVAYDSSGKAAVSYLGGGNDQSVDWVQSDLAVAYRNGPGSWTPRIVATKSNDVATGNNLADSGFLVGLNSAIVFDGTKAYVAYRDGHNGQFGKQDWEGSDLELAEGGPTSWGRKMVAMSADTKSGYGGHISMVLGDGKQPALVHDQVTDGADARGHNILFQKRKADGSWTAPLHVQTVYDTQLGPSLAWDSQVGYGVAAVDRTSNKLTYTFSKDGVTWTEPDPVFQSGAGGWYPSLAFDPTMHEPHIAYYICSNSSSANEQSCDPRVDELRIFALIEGNWRDVLVDAAGGWGSKLAFLSTGKRVVAYRAPDTGVVKLAVEP